MKREKKRNGAASVILLAVVLAALLGLALFGLSKAGIVDWFLSDTGEEPLPDGKEIAKLLESLASSEKNGEIKYAALDSSLVKDVLATGGAGNQYLHEYTLTYGDSTSAALYVSVLRRDDDFHMLEFKDGKLRREVLRVSGKAQIFDGRVGLKRTISAKNNEFFEQYTGCVSALDLINLVINFKKGTSVTWKLGVVKDCTVEALREESVNMARITLDYGDHVDIYMLNIDESALYSYESYAGDKLIVRMLTTNFTYDIDGMELKSVLE